MGYNTEDLYQQALAAIEEHKPIFITELITYLPCNHSTFYDHMPFGSDKYNDLKRRIDLFKVSKKAELRKIWYESSSSALQICAYKLLATDEERDILSDTKTEKSNTDQDNPRIVAPAKPDGALGINGN